MSGWVLVVATLALLVVLLVGLALALVRLRRSGSSPPSSDSSSPSGVTSSPPFDDPGPEGTRRDLRAVSAPAGGPVGGVLPRDLAAPPGGLALLQLSSQFCADCRASRAVLTDVASEHPGVTVRDVDVAVRPELVRLLRIRRTPTTLVVDATGVELARTVGVPRRADLLGTLAPLRRTG